MDFINKLIKKGIFSLIACFAFFVFLNVEKISAEAKCNVSINDGNKYLVLNTKSQWSDSGVTFDCNGTKVSNVSVSINGNGALTSMESGRDVSNSYLVNAGFYEIKYFLTDTTTYPDDYIVRYVRVLPNDLNSVRKLWVGEFDKNTVNDDAFVKIVAHGSNYVAIGNFGTTGYVTYFSSRGEFLWQNDYENHVMGDIVYTNTNDVFYLVGQTFTLDDGNIINKEGFIKPIQLTDPTNTDNATGVAISYGDYFKFTSEMTMVNKVVFVKASETINDVFVAGYLEKNDGTNDAKLAKLSSSGSLLSVSKYYSIDNDELLDLNEDDDTKFDSKYNSLVIVQDDSSLKIVAVGSTTISDNAGALGGLVTVCDEITFACETKDPYIWKNSNGATTTTTSFNDLVVHQNEENKNNYILVGKSRVDRVSGVSTTNNSGGEDSLIVLLNSEFNMIDAILLGSSSADELYSIKNVGFSKKYIAVGKKAGQASYLNVSITENSLKVVENTISGKNGGVEFRDVFARVGIDEEINYIFVGNTQATIVENMIVSSKNIGSSDAILLIFDETKFDNYLDVNVTVGAFVCDINNDNTADANTCPSNDLLRSYNLKYGTFENKLSSSNNITTVNVATFNAYHSFENQQGVAFILGRYFIVSENPVAPNISIEEIGIDKWYLYSRPQTIGANIGLRERKPLWTTSYMPVDNNMTKDPNTEYYVFDGSEFKKDTSSRPNTASNYIKMYDESQRLSAAFQSVEKAKEYALIQEFERIALVKEKYNYMSTGIGAFPGEGSNLATQNYYFIYYIDLSISGGSCSTVNGKLVGACTEYTGYAFASLSRIKTIADLIVKNNNYFVSESNTRFNLNTNLIPDSDYFKEEMSTEKYMKSTSIGLNRDLYLEVTHYPLVEIKCDAGDDDCVEHIGDYEISDVGNITSVTGKNTVVFSNVEDADYKDEGRYVVRYCYNYGLDNQNCGSSASFVIDRTAPIINYSLTNRATGFISTPYSASNPLLLGTTMTVSKIADIDSYAYTLVNGKKYYLQCNSEVNSASCGEDLWKYVFVRYPYLAKNPDKVYNIVVYDRAGNNINVNFKIGTVMPNVSITGTGEEGFILQINNFYTGNVIDSISINYTKSEYCVVGDIDSKNRTCTLKEEVQEKIMNLINAYIYNNNLEMAKADEMLKQDPNWTPNIVDTLDLSFQLYRINGDGSVSGGLSLPAIEITDVNGVRTYTFKEGETDVIPISKGLYKFTVADMFYNALTVYAGIGLDQTELYVYVNYDDNKAENIDEIVTQFPKTVSEVEDPEVASKTELVVKTPYTYDTSDSKFSQYLPDDFKTDYIMNQGMYYTQKFMYVKFKKSEFGYLRISRAKKVNYLNGYGSSESTNPNLECLFKIHGGSLGLASYVGDCNSAYSNDVINLYETPNLSIFSEGKYIEGVYNPGLNDYGIYIMASNPASAEYVYLAFTQPGTYDIWGEVYVEVADGGEIEGLTALPVYHSFTIDNTIPVINFDVNSIDYFKYIDSDEYKKCISDGGDSLSCAKYDSNYIIDDSRYQSCLLEIDSTPELCSKYLSYSFTGENEYKTNIGTNAFRLKINDDRLIGGEINGLMVFKIDAVIDGVAINSLYNAYGYSKENYGWDNYLDKDVIGGLDGDYLIFHKTGIYTITFYDAARNEITYKFVIDKAPPKVESVVDVNGKNLDTYQQEYDLKIVVSENSFLIDKTDKPMLIVRYQIDSSPAAVITIENDGLGGCGITTGDIDYKKCLVEDSEAGKKLSVEFIVSIKNDNPSDYDKILTITVLDYFGNSDNSFSRSLIFDNLKPYAYFSSDYTPILSFGENATNEEREMMLTMDADASKGNFNCESGINFDVGHDEIVNKKIILCGDKPNNNTLKNNVSVTAYEAHRVTYNNFTKTGTPVANGTYWPHNNEVIYYKGEYAQFSSNQNVLDFISNGGTIYRKGSLVKVTANEYINPNETYVDSNGANGITLKNLYVISESKAVINPVYGNTCTAGSRLCKLYEMYTTKGTFADDQEFYVYDREVYEKINSNEVVLSNSLDYLNYGYLIEYTADEGKYLPALTKANSCVKIGNNPCKMLSESEIGKVKLKEVNIGGTTVSVTYYNIIDISSSDLAADKETILTSQIKRVSLDDSSIVTAIVDNNIWQIDSGSGSDQTFQFGLASNLGRPIIFKAKDGAGNIAIGHLETVISIRDTKEPAVRDVYIVDDSEGTTLNNFIKDGNSFVAVKDGESKDPHIIYYKSLGRNYLSSKDLTIEFDEPVYKVECSYYIYNGDTGEGIERKCSFDGEEYDYSADKKIFEFIYIPLDGEVNYFVNYTIKVYDFSNNSTEVNSLFIDREKPTIKLNSDVDNIDYIETVYTADSGNSKYDGSYLSSGFISETNAIDSINTRINNIGAVNIDNTFEYEVQYFKFNYNITYKNYILSGNIPVAINDGLDKTAEDYPYKGKTHYVLVKKPTDYVLRGNSGICKDINNETYCYVEYNNEYYESLRDNENYWVKLSVGEYIENSYVGIYKIQYRVKDHSGNISDILTKTVYVHDTTSPIIRLNGVATTNKYGYHNEVNISFENEREAVVYSYNCKNAVKTCELPKEIFEEANDKSKKEVYKITSSHNNIYNQPSIYKVYFHDLGSYIKSTNGDGEEVMVLKYNYTDYTFLIDRTSPDLYLNAFKDKDGNLYYEGYLEEEAYLYCVSGNRNDDGLAFGSQLIECKNSTSFVGSWVNPNDYVNMSSAYEYIDGDNNVYRLMFLNGNYFLYVNGVYDEKMTYVSDNEYTYVDNKSNNYVINIEGTKYKLKINNNEPVEMILKQIYKDVDNNIEYKLVTDSGIYTLYINDVAYNMNLNVGNNVYNFEYLEYVYSGVNDSYKLVIVNDKYVLTDRKNNVDYELEFVSDGVYEIRDGEDKVLYTLTIVDNRYLLDKYGMVDTEYGIVNNFELNGSVYTSYDVRYRNSSYQIRINDKTIIERELYNYKGELIYKETYKKLFANTQKYFYNTYYYMSGESLVQYALGANYDENNIYMMTSIYINFRNDGKYLLKAVDKAGNQAGRKLNQSITETNINTGGIYEDYSLFVVDNTAPSYNKSQSKPTGVNYWFSVPKEVITSQNKDNLSSISKGKNEKSYNLYNSGLNTSFFYAFATEKEALEYLRIIYSKHIESMSDNNCASGVRGFCYSYYDVATKEIVSSVFVGEDGKDNKTKAKDSMESVIKEMVYPTFSGSALFGNSNILQVACDETVSSNCLKNKDMYKTVYLRIDSTNSNDIDITESCVESGSYKCIKVNAKIVNNVSGNAFNYEIGTERTIDTSSITIYYETIGSSTGKEGPYTASGSKALSGGTYYIFEEVDSLIEYSNYSKNPSPDFESVVYHQNTSYYAIYVDHGDDTTNGIVDVYYDDGSFDYKGGVYSNKIPLSMQIKTNADEYYLILINNGDSMSDFANKYEIHTTYYNGHLDEVYSYLMLRIDGNYYNINDYIIPNGDSYYFRIPMNKESITRVQFIDRAGNIREVEVSWSKKAPSIDVVFNGSDGSLTATVIIEDTTLTKTNTKENGPLEVWYSKDGTSYSKDRTGNVRASLTCDNGVNNDNNPYGCANTGAINGINNYRVVISGVEKLFGFFKINLEDSHGNKNSIHFVYNPTDMSANYAANMRFIDNSMDSSNIRMITNQQVELNFNNEINYVILYKLDGENFVEVCNTKGREEGKCPGDNDSNRIYREFDEHGQYVKSILYYVDEGLYQARIINRASEIINNYCVSQDEYGNVVVSDECKKIKSQSSSICSWDNNPDYCDDSLEVVNRSVAHLYGNVWFNTLEIDKTAPVVNTNSFVVNLPSGSETFVNNGTYTNAELIVNWEEDFIQLSYTCSYVDSPDPCNGQPNGIGFSSPKKSYTFAIKNMSTKYDFWFEDYAGNSTINERYSFTVNIALPEIALYQVDENGVIIESKQVQDGSTVNKDVQLLCYVDGAHNNRCSSYEVVLERATGGGYSQIMLPDITKVNENKKSRNSYRYRVYVKNSITGMRYENLYTEFLFVIDKQAPGIIVTGSADPLWGIYRGEVTVSLQGDDKAVGTIYSGCILSGVDERGNNVYTCDEEPLKTFTINDTLRKTGIYKVVAEDAVGNVTEGDEIKYINIDNENPTVTIKAKGQYLNYDVSERGFTNSSAVIVEVSDNNAASYFKYRVKASDDTYGDWITNSSNYLEIIDEGYYEIVPVDAVGNEGIAKHFIIYRQAPRFSINVNGYPVTKSIVDNDFNVDWNESHYSYEAPIIKVTVNGVPYTKKSVIKNPGEYTFEFTDLAGNVVTKKIALDKNDSICLNNIGIKPKARLDLSAIEGSNGEFKINSQNYIFKKDDVVILVVSTNYFGGSSACGVGAFNYRIISNDSYIFVGGLATKANANKGFNVVLNKEETEIINQSGGSVYAIVIDADTAKKEFGFKIGENFFTKDPLGWSLIFVFGALALYVGVRLVFFRKKVKVL